MGTKKRIRWDHGLCVLCMLVLTSTLNAKNNLDSGIRLFKGGNYTEARYVFKKYVDTNPGDSEALYYLGRICYIQGDYQQSVKWLEKSVAFTKDRSEYFNQLALAYAECFKKVGLLKKSGYARKMKKAALRAVELDTENVAARITLFKYYCYAPGIMGGSKKKAREQVLEIMVRDSVQGHLAWAEILGKR